MQNLTSLSQTSAGNVTCSKNFTVSGSATFSGAVDLTGATVTGMTLSASVVAPDASDGAALGSTSLMWSDLFLASGGVINFNSGNATITHSAGLVTFAAGNVGFGVDDTGIDVTFYGATASYKVWFDQDGDTNGAFYFGADTKGIMTYWYGDTASYSVHFDPSGDTNGAWYFGADTKGIQVNLYGDITGCGVFWDPTTDTNGTLTIGGSGGSKGNDVVIYGATNAAYLKWDQSADKLLGYGNAQLQIGESTTGVVTADGTSMIYGYGYHKTNALTGTLRGVRGNAVCHVASVDGTAHGVFGRAANGKATTDTDGVNLDTAIGVAALVAGVGLAAGGPAILEKAYGLYGQLDIDAANLTVSDARGLYVNVQSGNAASNTLTACNLAYLEYESVVGTAPAINSAIKIATVGGATGATCLIDASTFNLAVTDTDKVSLIKFKQSDGEVKTLVYDTGDATFKAV